MGVFKVCIIGAAVGVGIAPIFAYSQGEDNREQTKKVMSILLIFIAISSIILVALCEILAPYVVEILITTDIEIVKGLLKLL